MGFWVTSLLSLAEKDGEHCPSPVSNSALLADLRFSSFPYAIRPSPPMTTISYLDSSHTKCLFSHHKENWQKFPCPYQVLLHLRVSSEGGKSTDPTYSKFHSLEVWTPNKVLSQLSETGVLLESG